MVGGTVAPNLSLIKVGNMSFLLYGNTMGTERSNVEKDSE
jgi:hypothetical protein